MPTLPAPGIAIVLTIRSRAPTARSRSRTTSRATVHCSRAHRAARGPWWSRSAGAVSDGKRWAWVRAPDDPITGVTCRDGLARFTHADKTTTVVDPTDGRWHTE